MSEILWIFITIHIVNSKQGKYSYNTTLVFSKSPPRFNTGHLAGDSRSTEGRGRGGKMGERMKESKERLTKKKIQEIL